MKETINTDRSKYKSLNSIPKESKGYKLLQNYIEIEETLFSEILTEYKDVIYNNIVLYIQQNKEIGLLTYSLELLIYYFFIRPKQKEIAYFLISKIVSKFANAKDILDQIIQNNALYRSSYRLMDFLYFAGIISKQPDSYEKRKESIFSLYPKETLEFTLKEDDLNELRNYYNSNININITKDYIFVYNR